MKTVKVDNEPKYYKPNYIHTNHMSPANLHQSANHNINFTEEGCILCTKNKRQYYKLHVTSNYQAVIFYY